MGIQIAGQTSTGMQSLNDGSVQSNNWFRVSNAEPDTFALAKISDGSPVDSTSFNAYSHSDAFVLFVPPVSVEAISATYPVMVTVSDASGASQPFVTGDKVTLVDVGGMTTLDMVTFVVDCDVKDRITITGITKSSQAVVTAPNHRLSNGDTVVLSNVGGMTQVSGLTFKVAEVSGDNFKIVDAVDGFTFVDSSNYLTFTSGGTVDYLDLGTFALQDAETGSWIDGRQWSTPYDSVNKATAIYFSAHGYPKWACESKCCGKGSEDGSGTCTCDEGFFTDQLGNQCGSRCKHGYEVGHTLCGPDGGTPSCLVEPAEAMAGVCICDGGYMGTHCDVPCGSTPVVSAHCAFKPHGLSALDDLSTLRTPATITLSRDSPTESELECETPPFPVGYDQVSVEVSLQNMKQVDKTRYENTEVCDDEPSLPAREELTTNGVSVKVF